MGRVPDRSTEIRCRGRAERRLEVAVTVGLTGPATVDWRRQSVVLGLTCCRLAEVPVAHAIVVGEKFVSGGAIRDAVFANVHTRQSPSSRTRPTRHVSV